MIKINKPKDIPSFLTDNKAQTEFDKNISEKDYKGKNDIYQKIKSELKEIYHKKCAYCETDISASAYFHIEHYRPKKQYYWLAYSWDNLLLSCPKCNLNKGEKFEINNDKIKYKGQSLSNLHDKTHDFDKIEDPLLINPEQISENELKEQFTFNTDASIFPKKERMKYTVDTCELNRDELKNKRLKIINNLNYRFVRHKDKKETLKIIKSELKNSIKSNEEYIAWREFLLKYISQI